MFFRKTDSEVSGIEITSSFIRFVTVVLKSSVWHETVQFEIEIPDGLVKPSFNKANIQNRSEFLDIMQQLRDKTGKKACPVGVSLPGESVKVAIKSFPKLPEGEDGIRDMLLWSFARSSVINPDNIEVKWSVFKNRPDMPSSVPSNIIIVAGLVSRSVLREYSDVLNESLFIPRAISSSDLNLFNFYSSAVPETGTIAWIGILRETISLFVFKDTKPVFYKNIKKRLIAQNDSDNIDMLIQYFMDENPDLAIQKCYLSSSSSCFSNTLSVSMLNMAEHEFMSPFNHISIHSANNSGSLWNYASAVGAAWSTIEA